MKEKSKIFNDKKDKIILFLIIVIVGLLALCSYFKSSTPSATKDYERVYLNSNIIDAICTEDKTQMEKLIHNEYELSELLEENFFDFTGKNADDLFFDNDEISLALSDIEGPIVVQIVADWCDYCVQETDISLDKIIEDHPNCTFIQYMASGGQEAIDRFYEKIGRPANKKLFLAYSSPVIDNFIGTGYKMSYPSMLFIDKAHIVKGYADGELTTKMFDAIYTITNSYQTQDVVTEYGEKIADALAKKQKALKYIETLEYIDVPKEELE